VSNNLNSIFLNEDRDYTFNSLSREIANQLNIALEEACDVADELIVNLKDVSQVIQKIRDKGFYLFQEEEYIQLKIESIPPIIEKEKVNFGQWVGVYKFYSDTIDRELYVIVKPKVGIKAYTKMINDVWGFAIAYGPQLINYLLNSIHGLSSYYIDAVYSYLMYFLTRLALWEGLPLEIIKEEKVSRVIKGKLNINKLIKYSAKDVYPYTHVKMIDAKIFRALLIRFNLLLYSRLTHLAEEYKELNGVSEIFNKLGYRNLQNVFSPELIDYIHEALSINIDDPQILQEIIINRKSFVYNKIASLYLAYKAHKPLLADNILSAYQENIPILPLPSSKIYEFWILKLLVDELLSFTKLKSFNRNGHGLKFVFKNLLLYFNYIPKKWSIMIKDSVRPDYVISKDGWRVVLDAKYRNVNNIRIEDIERLIAYIVDISTVDTKELAGYFITLGDSISKCKKWMFRSDIDPNINIYLLVADPRYPKESIDNIRYLIMKIYKEKANS